MPKPEYELGKEDDQVERFGLNSAVDAKNGYLIVTTVSEPRYML